MDRRHAHYSCLSPSHPPTYYIPPSDLKVALSTTPKTSFCEWKGQASYHTYTPPAGGPIASRIWSYARPTPRFASIKDYVSFYASGENGAGAWRCEVDGEVVVPQDGLVGGRGEGTRRS